MEEKEDWAEHKTIITLLLEAFGLTTTHTVEDVLWAMGKEGRPKFVFILLFTLFCFTVYC